jgi:hypothetical protein
MSVMDVPLGRFLVDAFWRAKTPLRIHETAVAIKACGRQNVMSVRRAGEAARIGLRCGAKVE